MHLALIYARSENYCIGCDGDLPWQLPDEFAHFTRTTMGSTVIMGRRSFQDHNSVLQGRLNIVVSRNEALALPDAVRRAGSLQQAIGIAAGAARPIFVIGGAGLYREALPLADTVYETVVDAQIEGDTFIDAFDFSGWQTEQMQRHPADERHRFAFTVYRHTR